MSNSKWYTGLCSAHQQPDPLCRICNPALANARAAAFEEAAQLFAGAADCAERKGCWFDQAGGPMCVNAEHNAAARIRALSTTPPSGRFVANEVMERVEKALKDACHGYCGYCRTVGENNAQDACPSEPSCTEREQMWLTALAELEGAIK